MKNLGKILLYLLFPITILAGVDAQLSSNSITKGEIVTLNLKVSGEDIQKPALSDICGYDVISSSSQTSITMLNGTLNKSYTISYDFMPLDSCEIKPIKITIDSKEYKTKPLKVEVKEPTQDKNANFILSLETKKTDVLVGESFNVDLIFKQKDGAEALDSKFAKPEFKGFWIKKQTTPQTYKENGFNITKITYTLAAQREGALSIKPAQISIASRVLSKDGWGTWIQNVKWKSYFSNALVIDAKALPEGVKYIGDFVIYANADKTTINSNEALNLTLKVMGDGNLEDMESFKPYIDGVNIFDEKISIQGNVLTQKMAFVSDKDFVIPAFELKYFDTKTQKIKTIKTKEIKVTLKGVKKDKELVVKKAENIVEENVVQNNNANQQNDNSISDIYAVIIFCVGTVFGIFIMLIKPWRLLERKNNSLIGLNSIKDEKLLLVKLLPYKDEDDEVCEIVDILEKNIYSSQKEKIDMKILKSIIKRYSLV
jgi:hypothetical protein